MTSRKYFKQQCNHSSFASFQNSLTLAHDPGTSDDSGRASERLTTSSVAPRDADSSRDRLSDVSVFARLVRNSRTECCNKTTFCQVNEISILFLLHKKL